MQRILIIDDEADFGEALKLLFEGECEIETVLSGQKALLTLQNSQPFLVILCDFSLPDMTGKEIYEAAKKLNLGIEKNFIFFTGGAHTDSGRRFLDSVPNLVLEKPINMSALKNTIQQALKRSQATF